MKNKFNFLVVFIFLFAFTQSCFASDPKVVNFFSGLKKTKWNGQDKREDRLLADKKKENDLQCEVVGNNQVAAGVSSTGLRGRLMTYFSYASQLGVADSGCSDSNYGSPEKASPCKKSKQSKIQRLFSYASQLGVGDSGYADDSDDDL